MKQPASYPKDVSALTDQGHVIGATSIIMAYPHGRISVDRKKLLKQAERLERKVPRNPLSKRLRGKAARGEFKNGRT